MTDGSTFERRTLAIYGRVQQQTPKSFTMAATSIKIDYEPVIPRVTIEGEMWESNRGVRVVVHALEKTND